MTQGEDAPHENVQALRAVVKSTLTAPAPTPTDPPRIQAQEDIVFVDYQHDPATDKDIVLWDDVILAFNDALHVRHNAKIVPFLKGAAFRV
jgi:hypothetical protein